MATTAYSQSATERCGLPPTPALYRHSNESEAEEKTPDVVVLETKPVSANDEPSEPESKNERLFRWITIQASKWGMEVNGITPVPAERRTDKRLYQLFLIWFSSNACVWTAVSGTVGPAAYGLGMLDSFYVIIVVDLITNIPPAFFTVFGPKLGTRAMVQSRFSWGYYGAIVPSVLNMFGSQGYLIINTIVAGQTLAEASEHLNATLGIVIIALISLAITLCGCAFLHRFETFVWIPSVIAFIIMLAVGWKDLLDAPLTSPEPASFASVMSFAAALSATIVSWSSLTPDYGVYHDCKASAWRIFWYAYLGFLLSSIPAHMLGAAFTAAARSVPAWQAGLDDGNDFAGLIAAILRPTGRFGKFMLVLLSLTAPAASVPAMYTAITSLMTVHRVFARVPRSVLAFVSTAILIPIAIVGAESFYPTFVDIISFIGYWIAPFCAIVLTEHVLFRRSFAAYAVSAAWDTPAHPNLPRPWPALCAFAASIGVIALCMEQAWYTGPVARAGTGDLGMLAGFVVSVFVYAGARAVERRRAVGSASVRVREEEGFDFVRAVGCGQEPERDAASGIIV